MSHEEIQRLLARFRAGESTPGETAEIEQLLSDGAIGLDDLEGLSELEEQVMRLTLPSPSQALDKRFYEMLSRERQEDRGGDRLSRGRGPAGARLAGQVPAHQGAGARSNGRRRQKCQSGRGHHAFTHGLLLSHAGTNLNSF